MKEMLCLEAGVSVRVDDKDVDLVLKYTWYLTVGGYLRTNGKKIIYLHKLIAQRIGLHINNEIDHEDRNPLNCQRSNLREATRQQNNCNQSLRKDNLSGYKGVGWNKNEKKWRARIRINRKEISLGWFDTREEAALAYNEAAIKYHGEFAFLN